MTDFIIKKLPYDLTSNAGLALVGQYSNRLGISAVVDRKFPVAAGGIPNSDILKSELGLLVQGKNDFNAIEEFRGDAFFTHTLDVSTAPSCSTLRQRMDTHAASWFELAAQFNLALLSAKYATGTVDFWALAYGYMAVDWDTFVMNNSGTQKEAVGRSYQGVNILRLVGQNALIGEAVPLRHAAKRRRMKTVMQEFMSKTGRMIKRAGSWVLGLGANERARAVCERL